MFIPEMGQPRTLTGYIFEYDGTAETPNKEIRAYLLVTHACQLTKN